MSVLFFKKCNKKGYRRGRRRYFCLVCKKSFSSQHNKNRLQKTIWSDFVFERRTINQLAGDHGRSVNWIRKQLENYELPKKDIVPCETVIVADATYFKSQYGILVLRANKIKKEYLLAGN